MENASVKHGCDMVTRSPSPVARKKARRDEIQDLEHNIRTGTNQEDIVGEEVVHGLGEKAPPEKKIVHLVLHPDYRLPDRGLQTPLQTPQ